MLRHLNKVICLFYHLTLCRFLELLFTLLWSRACASYIEIRMCFQIACVFKPTYEFMRPSKLKLAFSNLQLHASPFRKGFRGTIETKKNNAHRFWVSYKRCLMWKICANVRCFRIELTYLPFLTLLPFQSGFCITDTRGIQATQWNEVKYRIMYTGVHGTWKTKEW